MMSRSEIRLTQYSHGAGCGCKISPKVLDVVLSGKSSHFKDPSLLVGNESRDDAAVLDLKNGNALISTTDFFMPIVDDPFIFGKIAAANAISDVYAMGGTPLLAIAVLGWPVNTIDPEIAAIVVNGGRETCHEAGIELAGGHSIDSPEPIFGLAVTGQVKTGNLKRNNSASTGSILFLTKPIGVGILTTAQKQGILKPAHASIAQDSMMKLNSIGQDLGDIAGVTAMTDVTGFGLLGHLSEMCLGSNLSAEIEYAKIPVYDEVYDYIPLNCIPGGTLRNWESYRQYVWLEDETTRIVLCDPQTSGGLLVAVSAETVPEVEALFLKRHIIAQPIGRLTDRSEFLIRVTRRNLLHSR
jgi:selenide, water dikinase